MTKIENSAQFKS